MLRLQIGGLGAKLETNRKQFWRSNMPGERSMPSNLNLEELVQETRVHRRIYLEQQIFDLEMERVFESNWVFVGHQDEISAAGDYKTVTIGTQPAIMTRDENGDIHVLMNRCMHRGSTVCQQERGNSPTFRCWYHGWTYNSKGELIGVPYADGYGSNFDRRKFSLIKAARVETYRGLVFASLNAEIDGLADYLGNAKRYIDLSSCLRKANSRRARGHISTVTMATGNSRWRTGWMVIIQISFIGRSSICREKISVEK
jgi:phenylpropionate dioxygenase-like ring-hydroxylating dioxygenase large terminal subunit